MATWTLIGIIGAALVAFFVDTRSGRRQLETKLDGKIDSLGERLDRRIDRLDDKIDGVERRLGAKIDGVEHRLGALAGEVHELKGELGVVRQLAHTHTPGP